MTDKLRRPLCLSLTQKESDVSEKLRNKGIKYIDIYRRGLKELCEDAINDIAQYNNS